MNSASSNHSSVISTGSVGVSTGSVYSVSVSGGIISGSAGVIVSGALASALKVDVFIVTLVVTALVASMTIGGKAIGKGFAMKNSTNILYGFDKVISVFYKPKK